MKNTLLTLLSLAFFANMAIAQSTYYTEDFEAGLPADFVLEGAFMFGTSTEFASAYFAPDLGQGNFVGTNDDALGQGVDGSGRMVTGSIDLTDASDFLLMSHMAYFVNGDYAGADEEALVSVSEDDGATWTQLASLDGGGGVWSQVSYDFSEYSGKIIKLAFEYKDGNGWNFGYCLDDISIVDFPERGVRAVAGRAECFDGEVGYEMSIIGSIVNEGRLPITELTASYSVNGEVFESVIENINVEFEELYTFEHSSKYTLAAGFNGITDISVTSINGEAVDNVNIFATSVQGVETVPGSGYLVEEATGTWCTWCPRGDVYLNAYAKCFPDNFVGVAVHNNDPMVVASYDTWLTSFNGFTGFPSVISERATILNPDAIGAPAIAQMTSQPEASIALGAEYDVATRQLTIAVRSEFLSDVPNPKVVAMIVEDGVTGTGNGWDQVNAYSGGGNGLMGGYELLPSPVPGELMVYNHVARETLPSPAGVDLDTDGNAGDAKGYVFQTITLNSAYNTDNVKIVGAVLNAAGQAINAIELTIPEAVDNAGILTNVSNILSEDVATVSPNPFSGSTTVALNLEEAANVSITLIDGMGRRVKNENYGQQSGLAVLQFDVPTVDAGLYALHISVGDKITTKKVYINK